MTRPLMLDLFCGAGGTGMGWFLAGFDVIGVDRYPQPEYPFRFIQADIRDIKPRWNRFAAVSAGPPCQAHTKARHMHQDNEYACYIEDTRALVMDSGLPYIIENVPGAPLINPVMLCGSMFNLGSRTMELRRHRLFEMNWSLPRVPLDRCGRRTAISVIGRSGLYWDGDRDRHVSRWHAAEVMGMPWVRRGESVSQAIPPAYTAFLGYHLRKWV